MVGPARQFDRIVEEALRFFNAQSRQGKYGISKADENDNAVYKTLQYLSTQVRGLSTQQNTSFSGLMDVDAATLDRLDNFPSMPSVNTTPFALNTPPATDTLQPLLFWPGHKSKCTFPKPFPLSRMAFKEIPLRVGPASLTVIDTTLELEILGRMNPSANLIKALGRFIIHLKKPGVSYGDPEHRLPSQILRQVQGRALTEPQRIQAMDADVAFLRAAWDFIELVDCMEKHLGKGIHDMHTQDKIAKCQAMEVQWNTKSVWDAPHIPEKYFNWTWSLQRGRDLSGWCTEMSHGRNNKNRGILLLLMFVSVSASAPNHHLPVDVSKLWNGKLFHERVRWIGEYTRLYMPELRELVWFLDPVAHKVYKSGFLDYSEREEFHKELNRLAKKWTDRAKGSTK